MEHRCQSFQFLFIAGSPLAQTGLRQSFVGRNKIRVLQLGSDQEPASRDTSGGPNSMIIKTRNVLCMSFESRNR